MELEDLKLYQARVGFKDLRIQFISPPKFMLYGSLMNLVGDRLLLVLCNLTLCSLLLMVCAIKWLELQHFLSVSLISLLNFPK